MVGKSIRRVAAIGMGTIGASWTALFLARGLTVSASDPAPGAETFLREFVAAAWPSLARLSPLPAEPPWAALSFHTHPEAAVVGAEFIQESAPERGSAPCWPGSTPSSIRKSSSRRVRRGC